MMLIKINLYPAMMTKASTNRGKTACWKDIIASGVRAYPVIKQALMTVIPTLLNMEAAVKKAHQPRLIPSLSRILEWSESRSIHNPRHRQERRSTLKKYPRVSFQTTTTVPNNTHSSALRARYSTPPSSSHCSSVKSGNIYRQSRLESRYRIPANSRGKRKIRKIHLRSD
jgi:hypothetical protein